MMMPDNISIDPSAVSLVASQNVSIAIHFIILQTTNITLNFTYRDMRGGTIEDMSALPIDALPPFALSNASTSPYLVHIYAKKPGSITLGLSSKSTFIIGLNQTQCSISVIRSRELDIFQHIIGWVYFLSWTVSFYPQIVLNFYRKSVVGLSFDFVALNFFGFLFYSIFNLSLYFSPTIQRGLQRISNLCWVVLGFMILFLSISSILAATSTVLTWLSVLYFFSYVKLFVTMTKYAPQAVFNCRRKSTHGWSIWQIVCDFSGGVLSVLQMVIVAINIADWSFLTASPTKLGLGFFSIAFDCLFFVQHFCLYRHHSEYIPVEVAAAEDGGGWATQNEALIDFSDDEAVIAPISETQQLVANSATHY